MPILYEFGPNYHLKVTDVPEDPQAPLLARIAALEEALKPFAALYDMMERTMYREHLEADIDKIFYELSTIGEDGLVTAGITPADLHRARAALQQAIRSGTTNSAGEGGDKT